jgi:hypothetical protein
MRVVRSLALALIALAAPFARGYAQTCQGTAAFQDGRARVGLEDRHNSDLSDVRGTLEYGVPRSIYGGVTVDQMRAAHGGGSLAGIGANLGYQIHLGDSPFQVCPELGVRYATGSSDTDVNQFAFGAAVGYRVGVSDWFSLVPAAGVWSIKTGVAYKINLVQPTTGAAPDFPSVAGGTNTVVSMTLGLVFNSMLTISPGVLVPSQTGAKTLYMLGVSISWAK